MVGMRVMAAQMTGMQLPKFVGIRVMAARATTAAALLFHCSFERPPSI